MDGVKHLSMQELENGLGNIRLAPADAGQLVLIVRRSEPDKRETLMQAELNGVEGVVGDNWSRRGGTIMPGNLPNPNTQLTLMNSRVVALVAQSEERWPLAGDQLYVDMDLSIENLPAGTRLSLGEAIIEVSALPHTGCEKFKQRFGLDALKFVNSPEGKGLRLRGLNAKVITPGTIEVGVLVQKIKANVR